ncbi:MAG: transketolase [Candidatus Methanomethyliaceae archaeon]|nr:transketolase [Candidatus Methanomethyliaceae archaeon]MDW7970571.1 transketolase [Nitrososphaerota archaeon]
MNSISGASSLHCITELDIKEKIKSIRRSVIEMIHNESGHLGSSLSCLEIITVLYFMKMRHNPKNPNWEERDYFILSKGHAAPALYAVLAEAGYFSKEELKSFRRLGSRLQGHPDLRLPGIEAPSGSLGQGLSIGVGLALGAHNHGRKSKVYVLMGDGECDEGQFWEALMTAAHLKLTNLILIIDRNGWQLDGRTEEIKKKVPLKAKIESFGWKVYTVDGHNVQKIIEVLNQAEDSREPVAIIAYTKKGYGISFLENTNRGHKIQLNDEEYLMALKEIEEGN